MVREDGATYYAENLNCDRDRASDWVKENVFPHLKWSHETGRLRSEITTEVLVFAGDKPEFWAYYADYDWVVLCQLFGRMIDLPKGWPMYCRDLKQLCDEMGNPKLPTQINVEHHALDDALWTKAAWEFLKLPRFLNMRAKDV